MSGQAPFDSEIARSMEDEFGSDIELDEELETLLFKVETEQIAPVPDIEDVILDKISPFHEFRKKGWLSVSDLVGLVWCEVQYDYRLRTMPWLPPALRPTVITSREGNTIAVDKVKVEDKEKVLKRGEKIHKRLEKEIHPEEIVVKAVTREDVWGLRFLNMFSCVEALMTGGKCRELPVAGFVQGILVVGIIDEIVREPIDDGSHVNEKQQNRNQTTLTSFFSPTKSNKPARRERTHRLFVSDSKTRARGTLPPDSDTLAGRLQVMMYKELLDALLLPSAPGTDHINSSESAILPTETPFSWTRFFEHLGLAPDTAFSDSFMLQSEPIVISNELKHGTNTARTLSDMVVVWQSYVEALGLGPADSAAKRQDRNAGRSDDRLELVYRQASAHGRDDRAAQAKPHRKSRKESSSTDLDLGLQQAIASSLQAAAAAAAATITADHTDTARSPRDAHLAHALSTRSSTASNEHEFPISSTADEDTEDDELAWAVEMSLGTDTNQINQEQEGEIILRGSQPRSPSSSLPEPAPNASRAKSTRKTPGRKPSETQPRRGKSEAGAIIGKTAFVHSPRRLATHLSSVLQWWLGDREAIGVSLTETRRCGWCEFEENCEWRSRKAAAALERIRHSRPNQ